MELNDFAVYRKFSFRREFDLVDGRFGLAYAVYLRLPENDVYRYVSDLLVSCVPYETVLLFEYGKYDVEQLRRCFPQITIVVIKCAVSTAKLINCICRCIDSRYFVFFDSSVIRADMDFLSVMKIFDSYKKPVAVTGVFCNDKGVWLPGIKVPVLKKVCAFTDTVFQSHLLQDTLYPLSAFAVYDRDVVVAAGMFDESIEDEYFSIYDFFVRSWLMGYSVCSFERFSFAVRDLDMLRERIIDNEYMSAINFRVLNCYTKFGRGILARWFYLIFCKDDKIAKGGRTFDNIHIDYKTLVNRWSLDNVEEVI